MTSTLRKGSQSSFMAASSFGMRGFDELAQLHIQASDRLRGVDHLAYVGRKRDDLDDAFSAAAPSLPDRRAFVPHGPSMTSAIPTANTATARAPRGMCRIFRESGATTARSPSGAPYLYHSMIHMTQ